METNFISPTQETPSVYFSEAHSEIDICGTLLTEGYYRFEEKLYQSLEEYIKNISEKVEVNFSFEKFNVGSVELVVNILKRLDDIGQMGKAVTVNWFYDKENREIKHLGKILQSDFSQEFNLKILRAINAYEN